MLFWKKEVNHLTAGFKSWFHKAQGTWLHSWTVSLLGSSRWQHRLPHVWIPSPLSAPTPAPTPGTLGPH